MIFFAAFRSNFVCSPKKPRKYLILLEIEFAWKLNISESQNYWVFYVHSQSFVLEVTIWTEEDMREIFLRLPKIFALRLSSVEKLEKSLLTQVFNLNTCCNENPSVYAIRVSPLIRSIIIICPDKPDIKCKSSLDMHFNWFPSKQMSIYVFWCVSELNFYVRILNKFE